MYPFRAVSQLRLHFTYVFLFTTIYVDYRTSLCFNFDAFNLHQISTLFSAHCHFFHTFSLLKSKRTINKKWVLLKVNNRNVCVLCGLQLLFALQYRGIYNLVHYVKCAKTDVRYMPRSQGTFTHTHTALCSRVGGLCVCMCQCSYRYTLRDV
jgi:hypothetical protein